MKDFLRSQAVVYAVKVGNISEMCKIFVVTTDH